MRVLAVGNGYPPHSVGGYEIVWQGAMARLRAEGHQTRILTSNHHSPSVASGTPEESGVHRELESYAGRSQQLRLDQVLGLERRNAAVFARHLREFAPDAVSWWPMGGLSLGLLERARRARLPSTLFVHDYWPTYAPLMDLWTRWCRRLPRLGRVAELVTRLPSQFDPARAGRWIFCSARLRERTLEAGIVVPDSAVLSPGVRNVYLEAPPEPAMRSWRWRLAYLGRVVEQKGVHTAVEALGSLPETATLRIIGDGDEPYRRRLEALARQGGVADRVRFEPTRPLNGVIAAYRNCDAVVFPVIWEEPFGLVPLEAMALGRAVIATGRGGSSDYLRDRENAVLFGAERPNELADAVRALARDTRLRERVRDGGLQTAARRGEDEFNQRAVTEIESSLAR